MSHRHVPVIAKVALGLGLLALAPACGGEDEDEGLELAVTRAGLSADIARARLDLHPSERGCADIRGSGPAVLGTYVLDVDLTKDATTDGTHKADLTKLRSGSYTLAIWGFDANMGAAAYGCAAGVSIEKTKRTRVSVTLVPYTP